MIPYAAIGLGVAAIVGIWAFLVAETIGERIVIGGIPVVAYSIPMIVRSPAGQVISLVCWVVYGLGCIIYLRFKGVTLL